MNAGGGQGGYQTASYRTCMRPMSDKTFYIHSNPCTEKEWQNVSSYLREVSQQRGISGLKDDDSDLDYRTAMALLDVNGDSKINTQDAKSLPAGFETVEAILLRHGMPIHKEPAAMGLLVERVLAVIKESIAEWDDKHRGLVTVKTAIEKAHDIQDIIYTVEYLENGIKIISGTFKMGDCSMQFHGGALVQGLMSFADPEQPIRTLQAGDHGDGCFPMEAHETPMTLRKAFEAEKYALEIPQAPEHAPDMSQMPVYGFPRGSHNNDAYHWMLAYLAHVPPDQWDDPWINQHGQELSFSKIMRAATDAYLAHTKNLPGDHSYLHMVEVLTKYHSTLGNLEQLNAIRDKFLHHELKTDLADFPLLHFSEVAHYGESLGVLLSNPHIQWSRNDKEIVHRWVYQLRHFITDLLCQHPRESELSHLYKGLELIQQQAHRVDY